jgi:hypothetical protein
MNSLRIASLAVVFAGVTFAQAPTVSGCPAFPANNVWNARVDGLPVDAHSADYINNISATGGLRYDITIPINIVPGTQPKVPININWPDESDPGPYPIPANAQVENGGDRHVIVVDKDNCVLYETYNSYLQPDGSWTVDSASKWSLLSNALRPAGWTSGDAAGLPMMPGLLRYDEVAAGQVNHALRFTAPHTQRLYIWPARHYASSNTSASLPPMGQRFRLKASFDISGYSAHVQTILRAMKTYGLMLADNGLPWEMQFAVDSRWNTTELDVLRSIAGSNLEAVDESGLMINPDSGQASQSTLSVTVTPANAALAASQTKQFTATVTGSSLGVVWSVSPAVGSVNASGLYTAPSMVSTAQNVTVTAMLTDGSARGSAVVALQTAPPASLASIAVAPSSVVGGGNVSVTVTLTGAAPAGGASILLTGSNAAFPAGLVTVPAGQVFQTFTLPTAAVAANTSVTISGSFNGASATSPALIVTPATYATFVPIRVNAGGSTYTDSQGQVWRADAGYLGGSTYSTGATVQGTTMQPLYQTSRYEKTFQYQFIAPTGNYDVTLKFAEPYFSSAGNRVFNVAINGTAVLTNFDLFAQAGGQNRALDRTFTVAAANGAVTISFTGVVENATVSGIQIVPSTGTAPPPPPSGSFTPILVHAGGGPYTDPQGQVWSADTGFSGGAAWATGTAIAGTTTPALYQTVRYGTSFQYQFAVPNGSYDVTLKFAEVYWSKAGGRVFNVAINGAQALAGFDIVAQAQAAFTAIDRTFPVTVANGNITIAFTSQVDCAMVNAIQITQASGSGTGTAPPAGSFTPVMVHAGGGAYTDPQGQLWSADTGFSGGSLWATGAAILNTPTPALYQTLRYGSTFQYQFAVPNGSYTVTLKFAEIYFSGAGNRVFNVAINGTPVLSNFDIVGQVGAAFTALDKSFPVTVANGQIAIQFTSVKDNAQVNAIRIAAQ